MQPTPIEETIALAEGAGVLQGARFFKADFLGTENDPESVMLTLSSFGGVEVYLTFHLKRDGQITFAACPNHSSNYQLQIVLTGTRPGKSRPAIQTLKDSLPQISRTIELYTATQPWRNYQDLLDIWAEYLPVLGEFEDATIDPLNGRRWWQVERT